MLKFLCLSGAIVGALGLEGTIGLAEGAVVENAPTSPATAKSPSNALEKHQVASPTYDASPISALLPLLVEVERLFPSAQPIATDVAETVRLVIRLKKRRVYVYRGDQVETSYPIAVGRKGWETPIGNFKIIEMKKNPSWQNPFNGEIIPAGSDNPLGSRWIAFWTNGKNYIGFHGTPNEGSVGRAASHGCIRMFDKDVQRLFELVKVGTPVAVVVE